MKKRGSASEVTDARFAAVHRDPRFSRFPRKKVAVTIDDRFKGVLEDPDFQVTSTLNKHGKKVKKKSNNDDMRRFYHLQDSGKEGAAASPKDAKQQAKARQVSQKAKVTVEVADADDDDDDDDEAPAEVAISKSAKEAAPLRRKVAAAPSERATPSKKNFASDSDSGEDGPGDADAAEADDEDAADSDEDGPAAEDVAAESEELEDGADGAAGAGRGGSDDEDSDEDEEDAGAEGDVDDEAFRRFQRMRGVGVASSSSDEGDGDDDDDDDGTAAALADGEIAIGVEEQVELDPAEWGIGAAAGNPEADTTLRVLDEATPRLAVVDLDWQRMRAVDIFAVLQSFLPKGGRLQRVTVYVSDYGREQMARERVDGPQGLRSDKEDGQEGDMSEVQMQERVRMYERSKLRWHFAIAELDSAATANAVYEECDGIEFEESSTLFDLRFVPDSEDFSRHEVRDEATDIPAAYEAPMFKSKALQHTKPTLTWDEDDDSRKKVLHRKLAVDEVKEDDFKAYLASDSEGDDDDGDRQDAEAIRKRYASLVDSTVVEHVGKRSQKGVKPWLEDGTQEGAGEGAAPKREMQVTFASGLENLGKRILEKKAAHKARAGQSLFEQYLQRKKEKKAAQRSIGRVNVESESDDDEDGGEDGGAQASGRDGASAGTSGKDHFFNDDGNDGEGDAGAGFDDDFFNDTREFDDAAQSDDSDAPPAKASKARLKAGKAAQPAEDRGKLRQRQAELELLMLDDAKLAAAKDGVSVKGLTAARESDDAQQRLSRKQLMAAKKELRKRAKERRDSDDDEEVVANIDDPRFKAVTSLDFAIDSTDPHFSRIKNPQKLISDVATRRKRLRAADGGDLAERGTSAPVSNGKSELAALVGSLKRKGHTSGGNQKNWG